MAKALSKSQIASTPLRLYQLEKKHAADCFVSVTVQTNLRTLDLLLLADSQTETQVS